MKNHVFLLYFLTSSDVTGLFQIKAQKQIATSHSFETTWSAPTATVMLLVEADTAQYSTYTAVNSTHTTNYLQKTLTPRSIQRTQQTIYRKHLHRGQSNAHNKLSTENSYTAFNTYLRTLHRDHTKLYTIISLCFVTYKYFL